MGHHVTNDPIDIRKDFQEMCVCVCVCLRKINRQKAPQNKFPRVRNITCLIETCLKSTDNIIYTNTTTVKNETTNSFGGPLEFILTRFHCSVVSAMAMINVWYCLGFWRAIYSL